jgi:hypothetical protein
MLLLILLFFPERESQAHKSRIICTIKVFIAMLFSNGKHSFVRNLLSYREIAILLQLHHLGVYHLLYISAES